jgi:hypothetical protein
MEASVCIATFHRPGGLARLLGSLALQQGDVPAFEVLVVDNDAAGSAAPDEEKGRDPRSSAGFRKKTTDLSQ